MFGKYVLIFLISMVPVLELRGAIIASTYWRLDYWTALSVCVLGNMLPVPLVYLFGRRVLTWGAEKRVVGRFFRLFLEKGEKAGKKLTGSTGRGGLFVALMLFVGIPLPGTGAWTGTLAAALLNMGLRATTLSVSLGVIISGIIMGLASTGVFSVLGF